jgi:mannose-1-phosphate guanylyltransferase
LHAVILAGGRGTRFWPLSTRRRPKQLLSITGARTMIQETWARIAPLVPRERMWVVTGGEQAAEIKRQLPDLDPRQLLVEPVGRNTAAAIGLAAAHLCARDPRAVMAVLPADHAIADSDAFRAALLSAVAAARAEPTLVTLGVQPTRPETGYGYIERGEVALVFAGQTLHRVAAFHEKPEVRTAERYVAAGHLWNAGIFVWRAEVIASEIGAFLPGLARALADLDVSRSGSGADEALAAAYAGIESISIDVGILERSTRVLVIATDCGWNDVGSWAALFDVRAADAMGNILPADAVAIDTRRVLVESDGPLVALVGLEDVVVIATGGAVLVCRRDQAQEVRRVVEELERRGRRDLT